MEFFTEWSYLHIGALVCLLLFCLYLLSGRKKKNTLHGSAEWMSDWEQSKFLHKYNDGLCIDGKRKIPKKLCFQHLMLAAPSGAGKTTVFTIPALLTLNPKENISAVVTDPSGEIFEKTSGFLSDKGFDIKVVDVNDLSRSLQFNPLARTQTVTEIKKVADVLVSAANPNNKGSDSFWLDGAKDIIRIFIQCLKNEPAEFQNLYNVRHLLNQFGVDGRQLKDFITRNADTQTFDDFKGFISQDDKVIQGMLSSAKVALSKIGDTNLAKITATETLNFEELRQSPTILYLIVPEHEINYYGFFLSLLYTQIFDMAMQMPKSNECSIFFLMDEFGNSAPIPNFPTLITTLRKRRCSVSLILQDVLQIEHLYGKSNASTILSGGCASRVYFAGLSQQTCQELERTMGKQTITIKDKGKKQGQKRDMGRALMTADEIRTMKKSQAIFIHANLSPIKLSLTPYYKQRRLRKRSEMLPYVPTMSNADKSILTSVSL